jgi:CubicO group peptidase (beta-lactamase class C family)
MCGLLWARFVATVAAVAIGMSDSGAASDQLDRAMTLKVDAAATDALVFYKLAGISIAVGKGDKLAFAHGYGLRDLISKKPVYAETWFAIASVSKQFTATAIMLLLRDKKIKLDVAVSNYWPQAPYATQITVRELLNQTTGLRDYLPPSIKGVAPKPTETIEQLLAPISKAGLLFKPGTQFAYSNTNYLVLTRLVQIASQMPYEHFIRTRILEPLELDEISPGLPRSPDVAKGYVAGSPSATQVRPWPSTALQGAGSFYATARGLVRWNQALYGGKILTPAELELMETPPTLATGSTYGFGLMIGTLTGRQSFWHTGGLPGYAAYDAYFPDDGLSIVVLVNAAPFRSTPLVRQLQMIIDMKATNAALSIPTTTAAGEDIAVTTRARAEFLAFQSGSVDPSRYDLQMVDVLTRQRIATASHELSLLGDVQSFVFVGKASADELRLTVYRYTVICVGGEESMTFVINSAGKIAGIQFNPL